MTAPTNTISIDRSSLTLSALQISGSRDGTELGLVRYIPPARIPRIAYQPDTGGIHGSEATQWSWQQAILGFDWVPDTAESETEIQAAYYEMLAAITQFKYEVTTQVSGAPAEVWLADPGAITLGGSDGRTYVDLNFLRPVYAVTIPVYPIPGA